MTTAVFAGFQTLLILNIGEFQNFARLLNDFRGIEVNSLQDFQCGPSGCVDIFGNSPINLFQK